MQVDSRVNVDTKYKRICAFFHCVVFRLRPVLLPDHEFHTNTNLRDSFLFEESVNKSPTFFSPLEKEKATA